MPVPAAFVGIFSVSSAVAIDGSADSNSRLTNAVTSFLCIAAQRLARVYTILFHNA